MQRFCEALVRHRKAVAALFAIAVVACALCIPQVKVNYSMADYLPEDAPSVQALDDMEEAFAGGIPNARLYVEGIDLATADGLSRSLAQIEGVSDVMWLGSSIDVHKPLSVQDQSTVDTWATEDGYLFQFVVDGGKGVTATAQAREVAQEAGATRVSLTGDAVTTADAQRSTSGEIGLIMAVVVLIVILILGLTSHSWFEPVIFLAVIGAAIVMNMGTNLVLGEISFISQICGAILQLAVSMDYAIVLLHTFRRAQRDYDDPHTAMAHAMRKGFSVVLSSAAVTFFGFLSLCVMRFGIGVNMGIVLAKGIVFSFLAVMFLMPCLILLCLRWLDRFEHRYLMPSFDRFARGCQRIMVPMAVVVVVLAVPAYLAEGRTDFVFGTSKFAAPESQTAQDKAYINEAFGAQETWVVMVPEGDVVREQQLVSSLRELDRVSGVTSYVTAAGVAMPLDAVPESTLEQVVSGGWSRLALTMGIEGEGEVAFAAVEQVRAAAEAVYGDEYRLVGNMVSTYDLRDTVQEDSGRVKLFSMVAIGLVLALMFRSLSIPFIVLAAIEVAIWMNLAVPYFLGEHLNYIGYLVIDAVQLGAAVDYAIIYAREYFDRRRLYPPREAARSAVKHAAITILTSATILMCAGIAVWLISSNGVISELGTLVARGAFLSMLMMFVFLPFLFRAFDGVIRRTTLGLQFCRKEGAGACAGSGLAAAAASSDASEDA